LETAELTRWVTVGKRAQAQAGSDLALLLVELDEADVGDFVSALLPLAGHAVVVLPTDGCVAGPSELNA
jgi:hypothetical protein